MTLFQESLPKDLLHDKKVFYASTLKDWAVYCFITVCQLSSVCQSIYLHKLAMKTECENLTFTPKLI